MLKNFKNIVYFIIPFLTIAWVVYINRFPSGYVYNSGDFSQPINLSKHFNELFYTWGNGISAPGEGGPFTWFAASPYYFLFYIIPSRIGFSDSQILSFVLFAFLFMSYVSFYISQRLLFGKQHNLMEKLFPLLYSINMTTLYFFTYTWGFSHHIFLYITLPVIVSAFYLSIREFRLKYILLYLISLLISIPGFTNPAFFVALVFMLISFLIGLIFLNDIKISKLLIIRVLILGLLSILTLSFWIIPTIPTITSNLSGISNGVFNLKEWLVTQSSDILSIIIGLPGYMGFPPFSHQEIFFYFFPFVCIFVLTYLIYTSQIDSKNKKTLKFVFALLLTEIILCILLKKSKPPFGEQTILLYQIPLVSTFRSYEKLAILIPFINLISIYGLVSVRKIKQKIVVIIIVLMLLAPFPFLFGGIQTKYSITIGSEDKSKNYLSANYSGLVKIPNDYYEAANYLNNIDKADTKIQSLPYSPLNTTAWVNFPKWKLIGFNITDYLFDKSTLATNSSQYEFGNWIPQEELNRTKLDPIWYIRLLSYFNVSHITYHFDVDNQFIYKSFPKIKSLQEAKHITEMFSTKYIKLYKLSENQILPKFYIPQKVIVTNSELSYFPYILLQEDYQDKTLFVFSQTDDNKYKNVPIENESIQIIKDNSATDSCIDSSCYNFSVSENGKYELQLSTEGFATKEIQNTSITIFERDKSDGSNEKIFEVNDITSLDINNYINLGDFMLSKDNSYNLSIHYKPINNFFDTKGTWTKSDLFGNDIQVVYKDIKSCFADRIYSYSQSEKSSEKFGFIITEELPGIFSTEDPDMTELIGEKETLPKIPNVLFEGNGNTEFTPFFSTTNTCKFFVEGKNIDKFKEIDIHIKYEPKLLIKRKITPDNIIKNTPGLDIEKVNPTKYKLLVEKAANPYFLVFNESYNDEWGVFINESGKLHEISSDSHFMSNGFSNGWIINPNDFQNESENTYELVIEYKPQKYFKLGIIISIGTVILLALIILVKAVIVKKHEV